MTNELVVQGTMEVSPLWDTNRFERRLQISLARRAFLDDVRKRMIDKIHYGMIAGTQKLTLYKPGAEMVCNDLFLRADPVIISAKQDFEEMIFSYTVRVDLYDIETGMLICSGIGSANSHESRYRRWVKQAEAERRGYNLTDLRSVRYDDGAVKYSVPNDDSTTDNTILKMAEKRAKVDAVLALGLSEYFTQDLEDLTDDDSGGYSRKKTTRNSNHQSPAAPPPTQPQPPAPSDDDLVTNWAGVYKYGFQKHMMSDDQVDKALAGVDRAKPITRGQVFKLLQNYMDTAANSAPAQPKSAESKLPDAPKSSDTSLQNQAANPETAIKSRFMEAWDLPLEDVDFIIERRGALDDDTLFATFNEFCNAYDGLDDFYISVQTWLKAQQPAPTEAPAPKSKKVPTKK